MDLFLPSVAFLCDMLVPKGTVGATSVFVAQLPLITWNGRCQMAREVAVGIRERGFTNGQADAPDVPWPLRQKGPTNSTALHAQWMSRLFVERTPTIIKWTHQH